MTINLTDPNDLLSEMEEPIRMVRGAQDALASIGASGAVTAESINLVADALYPATSRLDELWHQWAKLQKSAGEKEG